MGMSTQTESRTCWEKKCIQVAEVTSGTKCCKVFRMLSCRVTALWGQPRQAPCKHNTTSPVDRSQDFSWTSPPSSWTEGRMRCSNTSRISVASVASRIVESSTCCSASVSGRLCKKSFSWGAKTCHWVPDCLVIASHVPDKPSCTRTSCTPGTSSNCDLVLFGTPVSLWNFQTFGFGVSWNAQVPALRLLQHSTRATCRLNGEEKPFSISRG